MNTNFFLILYILVITSCSSLENKKRELCKRWIIDKIEYEGQEYPLTIFTDNVIKFELNGDCRVPRVQGFVINDAKWKVALENSDFIIEIYDATYRGFNNIYTYMALDSEIGIQRMKLKSDSYVFHCVSLH